MNHDDPSQPNDAPQTRPPVSTQAASAPPPPPPGYLPPAYPAPAASKSILGKVGSSLIATLLILSLVANVYMAIILASMVAATEVTYREGAGIADKRVVIIPVDGGINSDMYKFVAGAFKDLEEDPPAAVILRVNSGGGGVTASDQIWHAVTKFKTDHPDVKVIASFGGVAASGGYYIAAPADYIFCEQTGITGSIGVIAQIPALGEMIDKLGVEMNTVVADGSSEKATANNLFENWQDDQGNLTEEGEKNQAVLKNLLNSAWDRFVYVVHDGRQNVLSKDEVKALATGQIFTAEQAVDAGIVDEVGYLDAAIEKAIDMAGISGDDPRVTVVRQRSRGLLVTLISGQSRTVDLDQITGDRIRTWLNDVSEVELSYRIQWGE